MTASDLRQTITIQKINTVSDGMGGFLAQTYSQTGTARAMVLPIGSDLSFENGQTRGVITYEITIRYRPDTVMTHETRILYDGKILTPRVPVNVDRKKHWMIFEATEKVEY